MDSHGTAQTNIRLPAGSYRIPAFGPLGKSPLLITGPHGSLCRLVLNGSAVRPTPPDIPSDGDVARLIRGILEGEVVYAGGLPPGTGAFDALVLEVVRRIPYGRTLSYREVAEAIGRPKAFRAVGGALSRNPLPLLIPCHRVTRKTGAPGGYAGGGDLKEALLGWERTRMPE